VPFPGFPTSVTTPRFPFQVHHLLSSPSAHKLLILSGQSLEPGGDLILQSGTYSYQNFAQVLHNPEVRSMSAYLGGTKNGVGLELWGGIQGWENLMLLDQSELWLKGRRKSPRKVVETSRLNLSRVKATPGLYLT